MEQKAYMDVYKEGCLYETGIAVAVAKNPYLKRKTAIHQVHPPGTPTDMMKCPYYPLYCKVLGHVSCANKFCGMKKASKEERAVALKTITKVAVDAEVIQNRGKLCLFIVMV